MNLIYINSFMLFVCLKTFYDLTFFSKGDSSVGKTNIIRSIAGKPF